MEFWPALSGYVREEGVPLDESQPLAALGVLPPWRGLSTDDRARRRAYRPAWWAFPARNTDDLATTMMPQLMYERLDQMGVDFSVVYPSLGMVFLHLDDDDVRRGACRAVNRYHADIFAGYSDRITPVAVVPMQTPEEAIAGLDHAVVELGMKAVLIGSFARRSVAAAVERDPAVGQWAYWLDTFGVDSQHDYDPFWARCLELGVSVSAHSPTQGLGMRQSISNYIFNHIGNFATSGEALCKSLFLGGVTRRFPGLRVALLEGGVAWAASLYADLVGHWEKRNREQIQHYNPAHIDQTRLATLFSTYGSDLTKRAANGATGSGDDLHAQDPGEVDEFAACGIERAEDIRDLFVPNFFFGCEADDPFVSMGFNTDLNPSGARLRVMFGSDIGHWDVPDIATVLAEAYEGVEKERLSEDEFRAFTFGDVARFYLDTNPDFFKSTVVEQAVMSREVQVDSGG
ncbi:MAG: amidohydrolase family protein [Deltaproteobacteria bacterium]|nr:amidohydrolase family protein [Deltaproteobacteria bacterium]